MHTTSYFGNVPQSIRAWCAAHPERIDRVTFDQQPPGDSFPLIAHARRGWMFDALVPDFSADTAEEMLDELVALVRVDVSYSPPA